MHDTSLIHGEGEQVGINIRFSLRDHGGINPVLTNADETAAKARVEAIKEEWKLLWSSRIDDKVAAEGIANRYFELLSVDRGTVIAATRDFKQLDLREILRAHVNDLDRFVSPPPLAGGWKKFAKTVLNKQTRARKWVETAPRKTVGEKSKSKKGGRGWLHNF
jgi:hypothetical protein